MEGPSPDEQNAEENSRSGKVTRARKPAKVTTRRIVGKDPKTLDLEPRRKISATFEPHDSSSAAEPPMPIDAQKISTLTTKREMRELPPGVYKIKTEKRRNKVKLVRSAEIELKCPAGGVEAEVRPCDAAAKDDDPPVDWLLIVTFITIEDDQWTVHLKLLLELRRYPIYALQLICE